MNPISSNMRSSWPQSESEGTYHRDDTNAEGNEERLERKGEKRSEEERRRGPVSRSVLLVVALSPTWHRAFLITK